MSGTVVSSAAITSHVSAGLRIRFFARSNSDLSRSFDMAASWFAGERLDAERNEYDPLEACTLLRHS